MEVPLFDPQDTTPGCFAGIGSRHTPPSACALLAQVSRALAQRGWTLHSGGAAGADASCEVGCDAASGAKRIFLVAPRTPPQKSDVVVPDSWWPTLFALAARYHPAWGACSPLARKYLGRDALQVLGADLQTPVAFVLCWTPDGATTADACTRATGGTGQAIRLASAYGIPVYNVQRADHHAHIVQWLRATV